MAAPVVAMIEGQEVADVQHLNPVWRDRSDFIIAADVSAFKTPASHEQLWARQLGVNRFELCCIPFVLYDVALGDVVETSSTYILRRVLVPSGRSVFRVWFGDTTTEPNDVAEELVACGALLEWSSRNLLAVDAADSDRTQRIAEYLDEQARLGRLTFEVAAGPGG